MIPDIVNQLNDLKISANEHLDKNYPDTKREKIEIRKSLIRKTLKEYADRHDMPLQNENDLVKVIAKVAGEEKASPEEYILQMGIYALAWNEIKLEDAVKVANNPIVKPWRPE